MNEEKTRMIFMIAASVLALIWAVLLFVNKNKYREIINAVKRSGRSHCFADLLLIGFNLIELFHLKGSSSGSQRLKKIISDNHGSKYADYYYLVCRGRQLTIAFSTLPIVCIVAAIQTEPILIYLTLFVAAILIYSCERDESKAHDERKENMLEQFPRVISKLALLICSGMPLRESWRRVAVSGEGELYEEMRNTVSEIENGTMELQAYKDFGNRCEVKEIQKFASMLIQNMQKGSGELTEYMRELSLEMWTSRKDAAKKKGDRAASLLMLPISMIFIGILLMILAPAFMQMGI